MSVSKYGYLHNAKNTTSNIYFSLFQLFSNFLGNLKIVDNCEQRTLLCGPWVLAIVNFPYLLDFAKISFSIGLYLIVYFQKSFPKMSTNHTIKDVFGFDCCPYVEFWGYCMLGMCDV